MHCWDKREGEYERSLILTFPRNSTRVPDVGDESEGKGKGKGKEREQVDNGKTTQNVALKN